MCYNDCKKIQKKRVCKTNMQQNVRYATAGVVITRGLYEFDRLVGCPQHNQAVCCKPR
jgi:hypothetical protein